MATGLAYITIFVLVLSILFVIKNIITFLISFFSTEPKPIEITRTEEIILYLCLSYIISFIVFALKT